MVIVRFEHNEGTSKWVCFVSGAKDAVEARQAFAAVVITCQQLDASILNHAIPFPTPENEYAIVPAVRY